MIPDKNKIEEIIKSLQKILKIQDWDIDFDYSGERKMQELTDGHNYACCERNIRLHRATIYINKDHEGIDEWYPTLIHELYHIVTQGAHYHSKSLLDYITDETTRNKESEMFTNYFEQLIEDLAKGFANAYPVSNFDHILKTEVTKV
jgi:hypothetical protein